MQQESSQNNTELTFEQQLDEMKKGIEQIISYQMVRGLVQKIKQSDFAYPTIIINQPTYKRNCSSKSTIDSDTGVCEFDEAKRSAPSDMEFSNQNRHCRCIMAEGEMPLF